MIKVHKSQILGHIVKSIDRQHACPECSARATVFEDGSIVCVSEGGKCFEPEPSDEELFKLRTEFDARNGISAADREAVKDALGVSEDAAMAARNRINERCRLTQLGHMPRL